MFQKLLYIAFICLVLHKAYGSSTVSPDEYEKLLSRNYRSVPITQVQKINEDHQTILSMIKNLLYNHRNDFSNIMTSATNHTKNLIHSVQHDVKYLFNSLGKCVNNRFDDIKDIPMNLIKKLIGCVTDQIQLVVNLITEITDIAKRIYRLYKEVLHCKWGFKCWVEKLIKIVTSVEEMITKSIENVSKIVTTVQDVPINLETCAINRTLSEAYEIGVIGPNVTMCTFNDISHEMIFNV